MLVQVEDFGGEGDKGGVHMLEKGEAIPLLYHTKEPHGPNAKCNP